MKNAVLFVLWVLVLGVAFPVSAQEVTVDQAAYAQDEENMYEYMQATFLSADDNVLKVSAYDYDADDFKTMEFPISDQTQLYGVSSFSDIQEGASIELTYEDTGDGLIIKEVAASTLTYDE